MEEPELRPVTKKLSEIAQITGDAFHFVNMRFVLEELESRDNDPGAEEIIKIVEDFHKLCLFIRKRSPGEF